MTAPRQDPRAQEVVLDPDALARLEEERGFLWRSLEDLAREHAAGDVDAHDYEVLTEGYRRRLAETDATIAAGRVLVAVPPPLWRRVAIGGALVALALVAGVLVAQSSGRRDAGELGTGDIRQTVRGQLAAARGLLEQGEVDEAVAAYDDILDDEPSNPEAMTYRGWALFLGGSANDGLLALIDAASANPDYPDVHAFLAVAFEQLGRVETALKELDRLDELDPTPEMERLTGPLRARLEAAVSSTSTTAPSTTTSTPAGP